MYEPTVDGEALLTPAEVAAMFRVNPKTVTRWARAGKISAIRTLGGHVNLTAIRGNGLADIDARAKVVCDPGEDGPGVEVQLQHDRVDTRGAVAHRAGGVGPVEGVYGMHNIPGIPVGRFAVRPGPMMAAYDIFEVVVKGVGAHGAMPHHGIDPVVVGSHIVTALQSIVARNVDPMDTAVVSTTQIHAGDTWNVIPQECVLRGTVRTFKKPVQDMIEKSIERVARNVAAGFGAEVTKWRYERRYPATVNTEQETEFAAHAAAALVGKENVNRNPTPAMGSEDFAWMLLKKPGCYIWIGNGDGAGSCMVHNPGYDFNDDILPIGASYWATLVEQQLARQALGQAAE